MSPPAFKTSVDIVNAYKETASRMEKSKRVSSFFFKVKR